MWVYNFIDRIFFSGGVYTYTSQFPVSLIIVMMLLPICGFRSRLSFYGLYDGHAGIRASQFCAESMHLKIAQNFPKGKFLLAIK